MGKGRKAAPERVAAAVKAGNPPDSSDYADDGAWLDAQDKWITDFDYAPWPLRGDSRRRDSWKDATKRYWRAKPPIAMPAGSPATPRRSRQTSEPQLGSSRVLAGPLDVPRPSPQAGESQEDYELAMGEYALARNERRKLPRRTRDENAERMKESRKATAEAATGSDAAAKVAWAPSRLRRAQHGNSTSSSTARVRPWFRGKVSKSFRNSCFTSSPRGRCTRNDDTDDPARDEVWAPFQMESTALHERARSRLVERSDNQRRSYSPRER